MPLWLIIFAAAWAGICCIWIGLLLAQFRLRRDGLLLSPIPFSPEKGVRNLFRDPSSALPSVCVVVPARNEGDGLRGCIDSILAQDYPSLSVTIVDDRSTDNTLDVARQLAADDPRVTVLQITTLPEGWMGKSHALWHATRQAKSDWLLFVDADCRLHPSAVNTVLAEARHRNADLLTLWPRHAAGSFWEHMLIPLCGGIIALWFGSRGSGSFAATAPQPPRPPNHASEPNQPPTSEPDPLRGASAPQGPGTFAASAPQPLQGHEDGPEPKVHTGSEPDPFHPPDPSPRPRRKTAFANGQFLLVRRAAYEQIGGHRSVRSALIEDIPLAEQAQAAGLNGHVASGRDLVAVRMYTTFRGILDGWTRIYVGALRSGVKIALGALWLLLGSLLPLPVAVILLLAGRNAQNPLAPALHLLWALCIAHLLLIGVVSYRFWGLGGCRRVFLLLYPVSALVVVFILARSWWWLIVRRRVPWRNTYYRINRRGAIVKTIAQLKTDPVTGRAGGIVTLERGTGSDESAAVAWGCTSTPSPPEQTQR